MLQSVNPSNSNTCTFGPGLQYYWDRLTDTEKRMRLDEEGLFSLTLERVALEIANKTSGDLVVDAFCGAGGSAIGFARTGKKVIAIDAHSERLDMAKYNAALFNVSDNVEFICGDCLQIMPGLSPDTIFLDPPWGGTDYNEIERFRLSDFMPDGTKLLKVAISITNSVVIRLPKNFDLAELDTLERQYRVEKNLFNGNFMHYCAYFE